MESADVPIMQPARAAAMSPIRNPYVEPMDVSEAIAFLVGPAGHLVTGVPLPGLRRHRDNSRPHVRTYAKRTGPLLTECGCGRPAGARPASEGCPDLEPLADGALCV